MTNTHSDEDVKKIVEAFHPKAYVELLPQPGEKWGNGHYLAVEAAKEGNVPMLRHLARLGLDLSSETPRSYTLIGYAAMHGRTAAVEFLKDQPGVDICASASSCVFVSLATLATPYPALVAKIEQWIAEKNVAAPTRDDVTCGKTDVQPTSPWPR